MAHFLSPLIFLLIITFSFLSLSITSPALTPFLLSLNCSQPPNQTLLHAQPIQTLLDKLTEQVTTTHFVTFSHDRFTGLMQCRLGLDQTKCSICAQHAKRTISTLCPNADAVTAWFDGCYVHYNHNVYLNFFDHAKLENSNFTIWSCTNRTSATNTVQSEPAVETLLLRLRAEVNLATHHGFSYGELKYGTNSKLYGLVECVRSLSPKECEHCAAEVVEKLNEYCGDKEGGIVAHQLCLVLFESHHFYSETGGSSGGLVAVNVWQSEKGGGLNWKQNLAWILGVCSICLLVIVLFAWSLKRSVLNRAQVATLTAVEDEEIENKAFCDI